MTEKIKQELIKKYGLREIISTHQSNNYRNDIIVLTEDRKTKELKIRML